MASLLLIPSCIPLGHPALHWSTLTCLHSPWGTDAVRRTGREGWGIKRESDGAGDRERAGIGTGVWKLPYNLAGDVSFKGLSPKEVDLVDDRSADKAEQTWVVGWCQKITAGLSMTTKPDSCSWRVFTPTLP